MVRLAALFVLGILPVWGGYKATVQRDDYGVPHIYGRTDADVVFGLAHSMAEDNFWQLEDDYIRQLGRAAEVHGEAQLASDIAYRLYEVERRAKEQYAKATPYFKGICDAFAAGYNHYLLKHPQVKARLLTRLEGWQVLAFQDENPSLAGSGVRMEDVRREFPMLGRTGEAPTASMDEGSNMWAVSGKKSVSGKAMLFLNPHVGFFGGGQRYEAHLVSREGLEVSGFAILGTPYIRSGFDRRHGWCHTNNNADITDVWKERFDNAKDAAAYRYDGAYRKAESWTEEVAVRKGEGVEKVRVTMRKTHHGPIVGVRNGDALAKRAPDVTALDLMTQRIAMAKARNLGEFQRAMQRRAITGSNTMYADAKGNIYYVHGNAIPKRSAKFNWVEPVDGWTSETEWQGLHEFSELAQFTNPASGYLQNCNSTPVFAAGDPGTGATYPAYFVPEQDTLRAKRSREVLTGTEKFSFETWSQAAFSTGIYLAKPEVKAFEEKWPAFARAYPKRAQALEPLRKELLQWDGTSSHTSVATSLFMAAYLLRPNRTMERGFLTPESLEKAKAELEQDFRTWRTGWGEINRLQRVHTSGTLEAHSDAKPSLPVAGTTGMVGNVFVFTASTPKGEKKMYGRSGNTYVAVVEFGKKLRAGSQLVFGQSADPASPHYFDQAALYSERRFKPVAYEKGDVKKRTKSTLVLEAR